jgi:hypothetical protein
MRKLPSPGSVEAVVPTVMISQAMRKYQPPAHDRI